MNDNKVKTKERRGVPIAVIAISTAVIIVATAFFIPKNNGSFNLRSMTAYFQLKNFFSDVVGERFEAAAEQIYFYNGTTDSPSEDIQAAKAEWVDRLRGAKSDSLSEYMVSYSNLDVYLEEGSLCASVSVSISTRGVARQYNTRLHLYDGKIAGISLEEVLTDYEKIISGDMSI